MYRSFDDDFYDDLIDDFIRGVAPVSPRPRAWMEDNFDAMEDAFDFGSPTQAARRVRPDLVSCNRPSAAVAVITGPNPTARIQAANTRAITLLDRVITTMEQARRRIIGGRAPVTAVDPELRTALRTRFGMDADNRALWSGSGSRSALVLIRRFRGARQILADGWMAYTCLGAAAPATVTVNRGGTPCTVEGCAGEVAFTCGGNSRIVLCRPFWRDARNRIQDLDFQASTLLHECFHIYFEGVIRDRQAANIGNAHCYEQFVLDLNFLPVPAEFKAACP